MCICDTEDHFFLFFLFSFIACPFLAFPGDFGYFLFQFFLANFLSVSSFLGIFLVFGRNFPPFSFLLFLPFPFFLFFIFVNTGLFHFENFPCFFP